jgi:RND family efflux transporter MFP subunit
MMLAVVRRKWFWGALVLGLALGAALWVYYQAREARDLADPARARQLGRPIPVRTAQVTLEKVEEVIGGTATTIASKTAVVQASANGPGDLVVKAVPVRNGSYVSRDTVLIELEPELFVKAVKHHEAEFEAAKASLENAKATASANEQLRQLALSRAEADVAYYKREIELRAKHRQEAATLYKKERSAQSANYYYEAANKHEQALRDLGKAEKDLQTAKTNMTTGLLADRAIIAKARSDLAAAEEHLALAREGLEQCRLKALVDGLVDGLALVPGQRIKPYTPLAQVLQIDPLFVKMDFPQERLGDLALGQQAEVVLDSFPQETFSGKVVRILPELDAKLRILPVWIQLANPKHRLRPGITGFARIHAVKQALVVPATAIISRDGKAMVFRVEQGRARLRPVKVGATVGIGMREINSGLTMGDEVVIYSNFYSDAGNLVHEGGFLQDNDPVDSNWRKWARRDE